MAKNRPGYGKKQSPLHRLIEQALVKPYIPGKPIPKGWALCCPFCETYKMTATRLGSLLGDTRGFQCRGSGRYALQPDITGCGKFIGKLEADAHRALYIVEE
jgi:hypothetical protein